MSNGHLTIDRTAANAEFVVDLFYLYDTNGNAVLEKDELDISSKSEIKAWNSFCKKNHLEDGININNIETLITNTEARLGLLRFVPKIADYWTNKNSGLYEKNSQFHSIMLMVPELQQMDQKTAIQMIQKMRDFWIRFDAFSNAANISTKSYEAYVSAVENYIKLVAQSRPQKDFLFFVESVTGKLLETADAERAIGTAKDVIELMIDFWTVFDNAAKSELIPSVDYVIYADGLEAYLSTTVRNKPLEQSYNYLQTIKMVLSKTENIKKLADDLLISRLINTKNGLQKLYEQMKSEPLPGCKNVLAYDIGKDEFKLMYDVAGKKDLKNTDGIVALAVKWNSKDVVTKRVEGPEIEIFWWDVKQTVPWVVNAGRIYLLEAVRRAQGFLNGKNSKMLIAGMEGTNLADYFPADLAMAIVYAEREIKKLSEAETANEVLETAANVDIMIALDGPNAYCTDESSEYARGVAQLKEITYDDINRLYPGTLSGTFIETINDLDDSLIAMFLVFAIKSLYLVSQLEKNGKTLKTIQNNKFLQALAIEYHIGDYENTAVNVMLGRTPPTPYAIAVDNVLNVF